MALVFLKSSRRRQATIRRPEKILAALMLVFAANIVHAALIRPSVFGQRFFHTALEPFQLLFGPLVYEYVRVLVNPDARTEYRKAFAKQAAVFIAITVIFSLTGIILPLDEGIRKVFDGCAGIVTLTYLFHFLARTLRLVHKHRLGVQDEFASTRDVDLSWIRIFIIAFLFIEFTWIMILVWVLHFDGSLHFAYMNALVSSLVVYALGFRGLFQKPEVRLPEEPPTEPPAVRSKYARSALDDGEIERLKSGLLETMETAKPWLDGELNLQSLADFCGLSRHNLTEVINRSCGANFCDFINGYRLGEFKRLLAQPDSGKYTLLGLALDSGFNSKATFNAAFRKATGITPSAYRASLTKK